MSDRINVNTDEINEFAEDIKIKFNQISLILDQMINESENVTPFFNTRSGKLLNTKLLEFLNQKKIAINNMNSNLLANVFKANEMYENSFELLNRMVSK